MHLSYVPIPNTYWTACASLRYDRSVQVIASTNALFHCPDSLLCWYLRNLSGDSCDIDWYGHGLHWVLESCLKESHTKDGWHIGLISLFYFPMNPARYSSRCLFENSLKEYVGSRKNHLIARCIFHMAGTLTHSSSSFLSIMNNHSFMSHIVRKTGIFRDLGTGIFVPSEGRGPKISGNNLKGRETENM
jgi:hypothetical protein